VKLARIEVKNYRSLFADSTDTAFTLDGLQHLALARHAHDDRAAAVQVDPDVLSTQGPPSPWLV